MPDAWYEEVDASTRLTQGDLILNCPLVTWNPQPLQPDVGDATEGLRAMVDAVEADVVVMTQACDLEQEKVNNVVWPPALKDAGAWPLTSLRQSFLNGALTRLPDPDTTLRHKIVEFVERGDFGLASGQKPDGTYERVWYAETLAPEEVSFEAKVFLLMKTKALKTKAAPQQEPEDTAQPIPLPQPSSLPDLQPTPSPQEKTLRLVGTVPPEIWNRLGVKLLAKLRTGENLKVGVDFSVTVKGEIAQSMETELRQTLEDLGLEHSIRIEHTR